MADGPGPARTAAVSFVLTGVLVAVGGAIAVVTGVDPVAAIAATAVAALVAVVALRFVAPDDAGEWRPLSLEEYAHLLPEPDDGSADGAGEGAAAQRGGEAADGDDAG